MKSFEVGYIVILFLSEWLHMYAKISRWRVWDRGGGKLYNWRARSRRYRSIYMSQPPWRRPCWLHLMSWSNNVEIERICMQFFVSSPNCCLEGVLSLLSTVDWPKFLIVLHNYFSYYLQSLYYPWNRVAQETRIIEFLW